MSPVSDQHLVRVTSEPITAQEAVDFVGDAGSGGTCVFVGTVRDHSDAGDVTGLTYEAWEELAIVRLGELADDMTARWPVRKEACRHGIERLKEDAPIWKKESLASGDAHWVMGS
jgi:molybdopterin synthase catalytic subunit